MQYPDTIGWSVYKARYLMRKRIQDKLKDCNISSEQWSVLRSVSMEEGRNQKALARMLLKDGATITRILNILEDKKLVHRENSPNDKREFLVYLTDKGHDLYINALKVVSQNENEIESIFSEPELEQLKYLLNKLVSNVE